MVPPVFHIERYVVPDAASNGAALVRMYPESQPKHVRLEVVPIGSGMYKTEAVIYALNSSRSDLVDRFFNIVHTEQDVTTSPAKEAIYVGTFDLSGFSLHLFEVFPVSG